MVRLLVQLILTLLAISVLLFFATSLLPGDVASALLGQDATPEALDAIRRSLGLYDPGPIRFAHWLIGAVQGDFGQSLASGRAVTTEIAPRLANTLFLAGLAGAISVPLALGLGVLSVMREGGWLDRLASILSLLAVSVPEFLVAFLLIAELTVRLGWLPSLAIIRPDAGFAGRIGAIALPTITLVLVSVAHMLRMTRASLIATLSAPYIEMAYLKGLRRRTVVLRHALPNAASPIIAAVGLTLASLVVGVVVVEVIFVYPGIGQLMVDAVSKRDVPVVQACGIIFAATYLCLNTCADLIALMINPRLKQRRGDG
jgi:peptide/nickel transport system permease protein